METEYKRKKKHYVSYAMLWILQIVRTSTGIQSGIIIRKIERFVQLLYAWPKHLQQSYAYFFNAMIICEIM